MEVEAKAEAEVGGCGCGWFERRCSGGLRWSVGIHLMGRMSMLRHPRGS